ncbi:MAG: cytochrome c family protein [Labilithrix sp.]|nr:cytochrome c family protein [Labilithrix sp.]
MRGVASAASIGLALAIVSVAAASCSSGEDEPKITLTGQALQDPNNCLPCHDAQFREWSSSMHAYAAEDPVFVAMNKRMLRETNGASGDFCVGCHAPMALRLGLTKDGSNLADLPTAVRGVTSSFCHAADAVEGTHNNPLRLANDDVMRGAIRDPAKSMPHRGAHSPLHDRESPESSSLCGACHDVVTPHGAHIERTFDEWKNSLYSKPGQLSCGKCHMDGREGQASQTSGAPTRRVHDHSMPAVDIALTPFFGEEAQRAAVQRLLDQTLITKLCVKQTPLGIIADVTMDNAFAGHEFPSGAAQDRRVWVELFAYRAGAPIFSSGVVEDRKAAAKLSDPNHWLLRDKIFTTDGRETHLFWEAARVEQEQLPAAVTNDPLDPRFIHSVTRTYTLPAAPDRVTMRVRMRPLDFDLLDDLVSSGDLDPTILDKVPTYDLASGTKEWTSEIGYARCVE